MRTTHPGRFAGVLGWPLEHTLSPVIHNAAFRALGLDWVYLSFPVAPDDLAAATAGLRALGAEGANVTMPHKEAIVDLLDDVSGDARTLGAVNTVQLLGARLIGHNTDIDGFKGALGDAGFDPAGRRALVLGAGGAARAVVKGLSDLGAEEIWIAARRPGRAQPLTELAPDGRASPVAWRPETLGELSARAEVVVNATPLGMRSDDPVPAVSFRGGQTVFDLVYSPPMTKLLERARAGGADAWGGLGMLVHQAAASFRIWTGREAPMDTMSAAAVRALRATPRP